MRTWELVAGLPIHVEGYGLEPHAIPLRDSARRTTVIRLDGAGHAGVGEDVSYDADAQLAFQKAGAHLPLAGATTLAGFSELLDGLELWPDLEQSQMATPDYRRWAFESAALDLALRQNGHSLADALGREVRPLTFGASLSVGDPPDASKVHELLRRYPTTRFKLDATSSWTRTFAEELQATGAVDVIDLKGYYVGTVVDQLPDPELYGMVLDVFRDAYVEDARFVPEVAAVLAPHHDRLSFDAPIHSVADARALPFAPKVLNSKPSRFGTVRGLFDFYDFCEAQGITLYGGGQWELAVGRDQIQLLAAIFHPDGPNDTAPRAYNAPEVQEGLPTSPLALGPSATGFGLANPS
jgi:hypothetical protein